MALGILSSGCATIGYYAWPDRKDTYEIEKTARVELHSVPQGATVVTSEDEVLGKTPLAYDAKYKVERTYSRERWAGVYLGCLLETGGLVGGMYVAIQNKGENKGLVGLGLATAFLFPIDCLPWLVRVASDTRKQSVEDRVMPNQVRLEARWPDARPSKATVEVPLERSVTVEKPREGTFDEALMEWAEQSDREPRPDTLYRLGHSFQRLYAVTRQEDHGLRARHFFERYLETEGVVPAKRVEVEALLIKLPTGGAK